MAEVTSDDKRRTYPFHRLRFLYILPCFCLFMCFITYMHPMRTLQVGDKYRTTSRHILQNGDVKDVVPECIPPGIDAFPEDFFTQEQRRKGGVVVHFIIVFYLCAMLAIVCDDYFVTSLEIISDRLKLPSDVAGATFMAVGTSSPELFSSIIGSFITEGDIGIGTIVGSAVFNILGVTGIAGIVLWGSEVAIDWYPISRDMLVYTFTVAALILVISNNLVTWWESLILLVMYGIYIIIVYYNTAIEKFSRRQVQKLSRMWQNCCGKDNEEKTPLLVGQVSSVEVKEHPKFRHQPSRDSFSVDISPVKEKRMSMDQQTIASNTVLEVDEVDEDGSLCSAPTGGFLRALWWLVMWPASLLFYFTIPDCRKEHLQKFFVVTFISSVVWLGLLSYLTVWMVTVIGYTLGIPDTVSGLTLLAAGTSIPEIISSIIVVRSGLGNMAMANLIGSNIFDILFCLGAPWFIKTLMSDGGYLVINSSALTYTTTTLLSTVVVLFLVFHLSGWKLNRAVGFACLCLYAIFVVMACMYELNVFGVFNPPPCEI